MEYSDSEKKPDCQPRIPAGALGILLVGVQEILIGFVG
jgi:hypothetical protein